MTQQAQAQAEALKPCPFCGGKATGRTIPARLHFKQRYVIEGECDCGSGLSGYSQNEVSARWNRRAPAQLEAQQAVQMPEAVYTLRALLATGGWGFANHIHKQKNLKEITEPEKKQVSRIIRITDCKDCPHKGHKGGFGNPAYVPRCLKTGQDLPYTTGVSGRMIIAEQIAGIPEWCPLEKD